MADDKPESLRALRVSSRTLGDERDAEVSSHLSAPHQRHHHADMRQTELLLAPDDGFVALERHDHAPSLLTLSAESLRIGWRRMRRAIVDAGRSSVPKTSAVTALSKRLTSSCVSSTSYYKQNIVVLYREMLCGLAATLLMIPETVAFSYVANLDPLVGLYATGFFGIIIGFLGGVPSTVAGAAGALAVAMPPLTSATGSLSDLTYDQRIEHLFVAVFVAGLFQLLFGIFELSRFFSMIPRTAHIGFLNGLALMMFLSQRTTLEVCTRDDLHFGECEKQGNLKWMSASDPKTWTTVFTVVLTVVIMHFFPRVPKIGRVIPPTLVVAVVGVGFEHGINRPLLGYDVRTIGDTSPLSGSFPSIHWPTFGSVTNWSAVLSCAASLGMIGIFESIMTLQAVVDLTKTQLSGAACRRECLAQGIGNIVCGLFHAMGGCSMIGQSTGNVLNGARHRMSAVVMGVAIFIIIVVGSPAIELVPVACLTGILLVIIAHTFYWPSFQLLFRLKLADTFAIVLVTALAAAINLAVAVVAGVVWQSLVNGWTSGKQITARSTTEIVDVVEVDAESGERHTRTLDAQVYHVRGTLLYSSVVVFRSFFDFVEDSEIVIVDLKDCHFADFSAVAALKEAATRYREHGKTLFARHLDVHAIDLVLHRDIGWQLIDEMLVLTSASQEKRASHVDVPRSPFQSVRGVLSPRTPIAAPYHVIQE